MILSFLLEIFLLTIAESISFSFIVTSCIYVEVLPQPIPNKVGSRTISNNRMGNKLTDQRVYQFIQELEENEDQE